MAVLSPWRGERGDNSTSKRVSVGGALYVVGKDMSPCRGDIGKGETLAHQ